MERAVCSRSKGATEKLQEGSRPGYAKKHPRIQPSNKLADVLSPYEDEIFIFSPFIRSPQSIHINFWLWRLGGCFSPPFTPIFTLRVTIIKIAKNIYISILHAAMCVCVYVYIPQKQIMHTLWRHILHERGYSKWPISIWKKSHHHESSKCKLKPQWDTIIHLSEWLKLKGLIAPSLGKDMEQLEFCNAGESLNWTSHFGNVSASTFKR